MTKRVIAHFASPDRSAALDASALAVLTEREREVTAAVAAGLSNQEIAERLFMSPLTAKTHVSRIMTKLGLRDRAQIVVVAYETGLVRPGEG
ncbi:response regulator transcription factor [Dactylosporangium sp. AC04546]|uniref:response regulator transcription factor n=1 Tax=Dactylosporangium sp. AC04546 TaxID=2862460 RepID=UPI0027E2010A|nr:response regulator transcription factor [Dactylosporangium sp. AC04546]WVK80818.1 response regulator transcription factor [Dactylosporangium sp. AC04546]